ncbi:MAG: 23S rRNA (pseudouridine(1915)-N(3))-methyltransferase RlmH [Chloroflexi bacterium]|nr:MAG: 23S rRNA (pseudouridine(1915)-N(3))-methyltransferase RlmH [Chloroflexota bacterium]
MGRLSGTLIIAAVGKMKHKQLQAIQADYLKRLRHYTTIQLTETKDWFGRGMPDSVAIQREGELLLKATEDAHHLIALTPTGQTFSSPELATFLQDKVEKYGKLAFLIGGPAGFSDEVLAVCHDQISLSRLTFPHELARIILLEQLYRACTILNGESYHK